RSSSPMRIPTFGASGSFDRRCSSSMVTVTTSSPWRTAARSSTPRPNRSAWRSCAAPATTTCSRPWARRTARRSRSGRARWRPPRPSARLAVSRKVCVLRPDKGIWPKLGLGVYVDASAQVIGDVELGDHASVWMGAVVRGDVHSIRIGAYSNVQDNCVVHVYKEKHPTVVADHVTVGHSVTLHGCRID